MLKCYFCERSYRQRCITQAVVLNLLKRQLKGKGLVRKDSLKKTLIIFLFLDL